MIDEFIGKTLAGKYRIEEILRSSDLGNIYRATHLLMEKSVSVKILASALAVDENIVGRFSVEARTVSRLSHPNILNVTDFGKDERGVVFIVMEDAEGESLNDVVKREGAFSIERAVRIARQIASALATAHSNRIVHRGLTSNKILVIKREDGSELIKVLDLGSFEVGGKADFEEKSSIEDLAFHSPEQCAEQSEADQVGNIYSLGIIFYEMLAGEVPFMSDDPTELMLKHAEVPPPPLAAFRDDVPDEIEPILIRALAKNPDLRYQSVAAFGEDLKEAMQLKTDDSSIIIPDANAAASNAASQNNLWKTAFLVLAGISLMAFGLIYFTKTKQTNPQTVQTDENGLPVQPLNPATGLNEQNLPNLSDYPTNSMDPNDPTIRPNVGGGDGYDPWKNGGRPPVGAPPVGGEYVTIPPRSGNPLPPGTERYIDGDGNEIILVPKTSPTKPVEGKTTAKPEKSPGTAKPTPSPKATQGNDVKTTGKKPKVEGKKPAKGAEKPKPKKPVEKPKKKQIQSGKEQDT